jgi:hypothetical protein
MWYLLEEGGFHKFLMIGQSNDMLPIKKDQKMHPQLINMNLQKGIIIKGIW